MVFGINIGNGIGYTGNGGFFPHPATWMPQLTGGRFAGYGNSFNTNFGGLGGLQVSGINSMMGDTPQFGFGSGISGFFRNVGGIFSGAFHGAGGGYHPAIGTYGNGIGWSDNSGSRGCNNYYNDNYDRGYGHNHGGSRYRAVDYDRRQSFGSQMGDNFTAFGNSTMYGYDRTYDAYERGDVLGGIKEFLLAPVRGFKALFSNGNDDYRDNGYYSGGYSYQNYQPANYSQSANYQPERNAEPAYRQPEVQPQRRYVPPQITPESFAKIGHPAVEQLVRDAKAFDRNVDGVLGVEEVKQLAEHYRNKDSGIKGALDTIGKNGGAPNLDITKLENLIGNRNEALTLVLGEKYTVQDIKNIDTDKNGTISYKEFVAAAQNIGGQSNYAARAAASPETSVAAIAVMNSEYAAAQRNGGGRGSNN